MDKTLLLTNERIFHTIQGEGAMCGHPSVFVRLSGCNLRCKWKNPDGSSTTCDTPHSSYDPEVNEVPIRKIIEEIRQYHCQNVVITGGEPFLQGNVVDLINELELNGFMVTVETNGTIYRETNATLISMSPKLKTSTFNPDWDQETKRRNWDSICDFARYSKNIIFKFVVNSEEDVQEIINFRETIWDRTKQEMNGNIWLMPQGTSKEQFDQKSEWMIELCKKYNWRFTDRLHIRVWGSKKGV